MKLLIGHGPNGPTYLDLMRILVTGSRDWSDREAIWEELDKVAYGYDFVVLVHGHCPTGADALADAWGHAHEYAVERHPAKWTQPCPAGCPPNHRKYNNFGDYCPLAGFRRNSQMVAKGADICVAFIKNNSAGATHTATQAKKAEIPTLIRRAA